MLLLQGVNDDRVTEMERSLEPFEAHDDVACLDWKDVAASAREASGSPQAGNHVCALKRPSY